MTVNFKEYFKNKRVLLEMSTPRHVLKDKITFDKDDVEFLKQFPDEYKDQALQQRYLNVMIAALKDREERRMPVLNKLMNERLPTWKNYYYKLIFENKVVPPGNQAHFHPETLDHYRKMTDAQKHHAVDQLAREAAKHEAMIKIEKMPGYQHIDEKFNRIPFEFAAKGVLKDSKGQQTNKVVIAANTYINDTIHRLETTYGHVQPNSKPGKTIIGKLGFSLWHAKEGGNGIPARTEGMMLANNIGTIRNNLQEWVNAATENLLSGDNSSEFMKHPEKYKFKEASSSVGGKGAGKENTLVVENLERPIFEKIRTILQNIRTGEGDRERNRKLIDTEIGQVQAPEGWDENTGKLDNYAELLSRAHLFNHAYIVGKEPEGSNTTVKRLLYKDRNQKWYVIKHTDEDGKMSFSYEHPKVMTWHEKAKYHKVEFNPQTGKNEEVPYEHDTPVLYPGIETIKLPTSLWKRDADTSYYQNALTGTKPGPRTAPEEMHEHVINESLDYLYRGDEDDEDDEDEDSPAGDDEELPPEGQAPGIPKKKKPKPPMKIKGAFKGHLVRGNGHSLDPNGDYIYFFEGAPTEIRDASFMLPTFGRWGEYVKKMDVNEMQIAKLKAGIKDPNVATQLEEKAKTDYENPEINKNADTYEDFLKKYLDNYLRSVNRASRADEAQRVANWMGKFMKKKSNIFGGREPNHNLRGRYPFDRYSPDWLKIWHKIEELPKARNGLIGALVGGVNQGIQQSTNKLDTAVYMALKDAEGQLYSIALMWLQNSLADKEILAASEDKEALAEVIKHKVADLVGNASQQDIAGTGTRRTRRMGRQSLSQGGTNKEGDIMSMDVADDDRLVNKVKRIADNMSNKHRAGQRRITHGAFDSEDLMQMIDNVGTYEEINTALRGFIDDDKAKEVMKSVMGRHIQLFDYYKELAWLNGKRGEEQRDWALAQLHKHHITDEFGKAFTGAKNTQSIADIKREIGDKEAEELKKFEQIIESNPNDFLKELEFEDARDIIVDLYHKDPEVITDLINRFGKNNVAIKLKLNEIIKEADKRQPTARNPVHTAVQSVESFSANNNIENWLNDPIKYYNQLNQHNVLVNPVFMPMLDQKLANLENIPKDQQKPMVYERLHDLRVNAANLQLSGNELRGVRNRHGAKTLPAQIPLDELQKKLNRALENRDYLLKDEVLLTPGFEDRLLQKIADLKEARKSLVEPGVNASQIDNDKYDEKSYQITKTLQTLVVLRTKLYQIKPVIAQQVKTAVSQNPLAKPAQRVQPAAPVSYNQMVVDPVTHADALMNHPILSNKAHPEHETHKQAITQAREQAFDNASSNKDKLKKYKEIWSKLGL